MGSIHMPATWIYIVTNPGDGVTFDLKLGHLRAFSDYRFGLVRGLIEYSPVLSLESSLVGLETERLMEGLTSGSSRNVSADRLLRVEPGPGVPTDSVI